MGGRLSTRFLVVVAVCAGLLAHAPAASAAPDDGVGSGSHESPGPVAPAGDGVGSDLWAVTDVAARRGGGQVDIVADRFVALTLNRDLMAAELAGAPSESTGMGRAPQKVLTLPTPDGGFARFSIVETSVMAPELAAKFPETTTYAGRGIDDPAATLRADQGPAGFHAQVLSPNGSWYIDPYYRLDDSVYVSYFRADLQNLDGGFFEPGVVPRLVPSPADPAAGRAGASAARSSGTAARIYRLAVAASGEYSAFHGGTVPLVHAAIVTAVNRLTGIYAQELSVLFQLVANNDSLIYLNPATDPYSNSDPFSAIDENQVNVDAVIGSANYDVGHVFTTGAGGLAALGVIGIDGQEAQGVTGTTSPVGDAFWVDYVAHEIGHQFGANHTFNGTDGSCSGNAEPSAAMEPGSGSTIMAYAGICFSDDLQNFFPNASSDAYFHAKSYDEMQATMSNPGQGGTTTAVTGNNIPTVASVGGSSFTIPVRTPFVLTAEGTDVDGDPLTYTWEQYDAGGLRRLNNPSKPDGALFRSLPPTTSGVRYFPSLASVASNATNAVSGTCPALPAGLACWSEFLPTSARTMNLRATVRDFSLVGGINNTDVSVTVAGTTPFLVTSQAAGGSFAGLSSQTISWDVASTNVAPINTANVEILLSTDGGVTFPTVLAASTPNDGSQAVTLPNVTTTQARIMVRAVGNIFFDLSDTNFNITSVVPLPGATTGFKGVAGNGQVGLSWVAPTSGGTVSDYYIRQSINGGPFTVVADGVSTATSFTVSGLTNGVSYRFVVNALNTAGLGPTSLSVTVVPGLPGATSGFQASAGNGQVSLSWVAPTSGGTVSDYYIRQSINGGPFTVVADGVSTATSFTVSGLTNGVSYRFVVNALNTAGLGPTSLSVTVVPGLPGATSGFKGVAGNGQVSLSWVAPTSGGTVSDYYIRQSINGGPFTVVADGVSTATSFTVTGLTNGTSYRFVVNAMNGAGLGPTSLSVTVVPGLPGATSGFQASAGNGQVSLSWVAPTTGGTVSDYQIRQSINGGPFTVITDGVSTATSFTVTGLTNGTSYRFVVNAMNTAGLGPTSLSATAIPFGPPGAVSSLLASPGVSQVTLTWVAPTTGGAVSDYQIRQSINGGPFTVITDGVSTATSYTVTGLTNGTSYRFVVNAMNSAGLGPTSLSVTVVPGPPGAVTNLQAFQTGSRQVTLTWNAPTTGGAVTDYRIRMRAAGLPAFSTVADEVSTATSFTITGITGGSVFEFEVTALNSAGFGPAVLSNSVTLLG